MMYRQERWIQGFLILGIALFLISCVSEQGHVASSRDHHVETVQLGVLESIQALSRPQHDGMVALFGNLHAHSSLSDDVHGEGEEILPIRAFEAAHAAGLDFLAITDHHMAPGSHRLWMEPSEYREQLFDVTMQYNTDHQGAFIAIPGIEWGVIKDGNHINLFGSPSLPPDSVGREGYDEIIEWSKSNAEFIQFNHPHSWKGKSNRNKDIGNYGMALYVDRAGSFVEAVDPAVKTMSVICTVYGGHITGKFAHSTKKTHRDIHSKHYRIYKQFLNMGLHLSPAANQDTHHTNWGTVTAARTGVWATDASYEALMDSFRANRVFATEDDELAVSMQVEYAGERYWMGETVPLANEEDDIDVLVMVMQGAGIDNDSTNEGPYTVSIFSDYDGVGGRTAALWATVEDVPQGELYRIPLQVVQDEYIYLQITEQNGRDNPIGDGADEHVNATGDHGSDGMRDDMNDSAWTTPVWFGKPVVSGPFVWSKNSKLYHDPDCWAVQRIGLGNRREGDTPGERTKHGCKPAGE